MDASVDVADAIGAMAIENGANGKLVPSDSVEARGEERDALADGAQSGESEVINPSEEVEGEATSHSQDVKPRVSEVRSCDNDTLLLSMSSIDGLLTASCFWIFFIVSGE
jgi:hypothetical protein